MYSLLKEYDNGEASTLLHHKGQCFPFNIQEAPLSDTRAKSKRIHFETKEEAEHCIEAIRDDCAIGGDWEVVEV